MSMSTHYDAHGNKVTKKTTTVNGQTTVEETITLPNGTSRVYIDGVRRGFGEASPATPAVGDGAAGGGEDDDPALRAAIEASLKDAPQEAEEDWSSQLRELRVMGFEDEERNRQLLAEHQGSVQHCIDALLGG